MLVDNWLALAVALVLPVGTEQAGRSRGHGPLAWAALQGPAGSQASLRKFELAFIDQARGRADTCDSP